MPNPSRSLGGPMWPAAAMSGPGAVAGPPGPGTGGGMSLQEWVQRKMFDPLKMNPQEQSPGGPGTPFAQAQTQSAPPAPTPPPRVAKSTEDQIADAIREMGYRFTNIPDEGVGSVAITERGLIPQTTSGLEEVDADLRVQPDLWQNPKHAGLMNAIRQLIEARNPELAVEEPAKGSPAIRTAGGL